MISKLKEKFSELSPDKKRFVSVSVSVIIFISIAMTLYVLRSDGPQRRQQTDVQKEQLDFGSNSKKDERTKMKLMFSKELSELNKKIEELKREKKEMETGQPVTSPEQTTTPPTDNDKNKKTEEDKGSFSNIMKNYDYPPPPSDNNEQTKTQDGSEDKTVERKSPFDTADRRTQNSTNNKKGETTSSQNNSTQTADTEPNDPDAQFPGSRANNATGDKKSLGTTTYQTISGISSMKLQQQKQPDKEKEKDSDYLHNYIPSNSIYKATLITGVYAPTMSKGQGNPYPVLMRLTDLSFLPNEAKRNMEGCYISGEAWGSLSSERVEIRLLKMSCLDTNKNKVIDTSLKGYVVGEDSTIGLSGNVVSKQGKTLAMAFVSNFLSGIGEGFGMSSQDITFTTSGSERSTVDPDKILQYGAGSGFSESFKMLAEFYTNILNETSPVIEVKAGRDISIIISEGKAIKIDKYKWDNFNKTKIQENKKNIQGVIYEYE